MYTPHLQRSLEAEGRFLFAYPTQEDPEPPSAPLWVASLGGARKEEPRGTK
jgi:hypothetical protein